MGPRLLSQQGGTEPVQGARTPDCNEIRNVEAPHWTRDRSRCPRIDDLRAAQAIILPSGRLANRLGGYNEEPTLGIIIGAQGVRAVPDAQHPVQMLVDLHPALGKAVAP